MKKKIVKILMIIVLIVIFFLIAISLIKKDNLKEIKKVIEEKENKIVYVYNSSEIECPICVDTKVYYEYNKEKYKLDTIEIDYKKLNKAEKEKIKTMLNVDEGFSKRNNIVYIKNGEIVGNIFGELNSISITESLYNMGYIKEEEYKEEQESSNTDIFSIKEKTIVLLGTNTEEMIEKKTIVKKMAAMNKVGYRYIEVDLAVNGEVRRKIREEIGAYNVPTILIIENKKIKSHTENVTEEKIKELLK